MTHRPHILSSICCVELPYLTTITCEYKCRRISIPLRRTRPSSQPPFFSSSFSSRVFAAAAFEILSKFVQSSTIFDKNYLVSKPSPATSESTQSERKRRSVGGSKDDNHGDSGDGDRGTGDKSQTPRNSLARLEETADLPGVGDCYSSNKNRSIFQVFNLLPAKRPSR